MVSLSNFPFERYSPETMGKRSFQKESKKSAKQISLKVFHDQISTEEGPEMALARSNCFRGPSKTLFSADFVGLHSKKPPQMLKASSECPSKPLEIDESDSDSASLDRVGPPMSSGSQCNRAEKFDANPELVQLESELMCALAKVSDVQAKYTKGTEQVREIPKLESKLAYLKKAFPFPKSSAGNFMPDEEDLCSYETVCNCGNFGSSCIVANDAREVSTKAITSDAKLSGVSSKDDVVCAVGQWLQLITEALKLQILLNGGAGQFGNERWPPCAGLCVMLQNMSVTSRQKGIKRMP